MTPKRTPPPKKNPKRKPKARKVLVRWVMMGPNGLWSDEIYDLDEVTMIGKRPSTERHVKWVRIEIPVEGK